MSLQHQYFYRGKKNNWNNIDDDISKNELVLERSFLMDNNHADLEEDGQ